MSATNATLTAKFAKIAFALMFCFPLQLSAFYDQSDNGTNITLPPQVIGDFEWEDIALPSFELAFNYEDIRIPGPPNMDLILRRRYHLSEYSSVSGFGAYWSIDKPSIRLQTSGSSQTNFGCLGNRLYVEFYMPRGQALRTVGFGSQGQLASGALLAFDGGSIFRCESNAPIIQTADGIIYEFEILQGVLTRIVKQRDRFGNVIDYNYDSFHRLISITRNDGASINLNWTNVGGWRITSATYAGRTVSYQYQVSSGYAQLHKHIDEELRETEYIYNSQYYIGQVTLPSGGVIFYSTYPPNSSSEHPSSPVLWSKTISGPGLVTRNIEYSRRAQPSWPYGSEPGTGDQLWARVTESDHTGTQDLSNVYRFHTVVGSPASYNSGLITIAGRLISQETRIGSTLVYELDNTWSYVVNGIVGCSEGIGSQYYQYKNCGRARLDKAVQSIYESGGTDVYETDYLSYDAYGFPLVRQRKTPAGASRFNQQTYSHDLTHWLIGRPAETFVSTSNSNWNLVGEQEYYSASSAYKSLPSYYFQYGTWQHHNQEYHSNGELKRRRYNGTSKYEDYSNYKYGVPRTVIVPRRYAAGT
ncbi:MAG: RHS repeat protein, partial [Gammaproteobacteria bacterium]|nr:RHS repeat protein [Gammaproteobacteria bacterium]